jgi:hypothetical protein
VYYPSHGVYVAPVRFYQPYYTFRPHLSLGFGFWAGFPVAYPAYYGYYNPYGYPYPAPYYPPPAYPPAYPAPGYPAPGYPAPGYPAPGSPSSAAPQPGYSQGGSIGVQPNAANMGGVSFEMTPSTADVYVDGQHVGSVGQFTPTSQPLGLTPGRHHIEIRADGYRPFEVDTEIVAGQVIPYRGELQR